MKINASDYEVNDILEIIKDWTGKEEKEIKYLDDLIKAANEHVL